MSWRRQTARTETDSSLSFPALAPEHRRHDVHPGLDYRCSQWRPRRAYPGRSIDQRAQTATRKGEFGDPAASAMRKVDRINGLPVEILEPIFKLAMPVGGTPLVLQKAGRD